jgi:hypothetical protein
MRLSAVDLIARVQCTVFLIMAEDKSLSELLAELAKRLPKEGLEGLGGSLPSAGTAISSSADWPSALKALAELSQHQDKIAAQKRAAETNTVESGAANMWFNQYWPQPRKCPVCTRENWGLAGKFAHVPLGPIGRSAISSQPISTFPCVVVTCRTCGNTLFFNAIVMGLLPEGAD